MRKFFTLMFAVMFAGQALAQTSFEVNGLKYTITDAEKHEVSVGIISDDNKPQGDLVIPAEVENEGVKYAVTSIGEGAFKYCGNLTSVTIPNSVTRIGDYAFYECSSLTKAEFASVESLCKMEFVDYSSNPLTYANHLYINSEEVTEVSIPNSITSIGDYTFSGCSSLTSVNIPGSVTTIGDGAFEDCNNLTSVNIPDSVTRIGDSAFSGCSGLTSVAIPNSVTRIGNFVFSSCSGLTSVTIPNTITDIYSKAFSGCSSLTSVSIPNSVTNIGYGAFEGCCGLTSVTIPNSVTNISDDAFASCIGLKSVTIPESVTSIGQNSFYRVKNIVYSGGAEGSPWGALNVNAVPDENGFIYSDSKKTKLTAYVGDEKEVAIPNSVTDIGDGAFYGCSGLTSVTIPNLVTNISNDAFRGCRGLTSVTIPNSVTDIGWYAFYGCNGLTSVIIPSSVISICGDAFDGCTATIYCEFKSKPSGWYGDWCGEKYKGEIVWKTATSVTETAANAVNIYAYGKYIIVENATDEISVYNVMGTLVCRDVARNVSTVAKLGIRTELQVNGTGVYIVKVGNIAKQVMVND